MNDNVRVTLRDMLRDRHYIDIEVENDTTLIASKSPTDKVMVYFIYDTKVSVKHIKNIKDMLDDEIKTLILVYKNVITAFAKQFIVTDMNNIFVQAFSETDLSFNVTKHTLVPKHEVLTSDEKRAIMRQYKASLKQFPLLLSSDPIARYYGLLPGAMVRITRKSPTAGEYVLYRVVV